MWQTMPSLTADASAKLRTSKLNGKWAQVLIIIIVKIVKIIILITIIIVTIRIIDFQKSLGLLRTQCSLSCKGMGEHDALGSWQHLAASGLSVVKVQET